MITKRIVFFFFFLLPGLLFAQREQVNLKVRNAAPLRKFEYHQPSSFEVVNGKFNAALASSNGYLFEITQVSAKLLKCKTVLKQNQFKAILIDERMNKTYVSKSDAKGTLSINCLPNGHFELLFTGEVFLDKQKVSITANLQGEVAHSENLKTY